MKTWKWMVWLVFAANLVACESMARVETIGASARVINTVSSMTIVRASFNGYGLGGGGGEECCIPLPKTWQPGMMANISWTKDPSPGVNPGGVRAPKWNPDGTTSQAWKDWMKVHEDNYTSHKVRIPVPKYAQICGVTLIFLPCDEVYPLIDCDQRQQVLSGLRYKTPQEWDLEVIHRVGGKEVCQRK